MKKILKGIFFLLMSSAVAGFFLLSTVAFSDATIAEKWARDPDMVVFSAASATQSGISLSDAKQKISVTNPQQVIHADLGRLSSVFLMQNLQKQPFEAEKVLKKKGENITIGDVRAIFSWYDPFKKFVLFDEQNTFKLTQRTNGSLYFGRENDGTVVLYSLDLVAQLTFIHAGEDMTSMIIFPGMYVRFDPKNNKSLKDADLFRIIQTLGYNTDLVKWENSKNTSKKMSELNTAIDFVDARSLGTPDHPLHPYMLSASLPLFDMVYQFFVQKIGDLDELKEYSTKKTSYFQGEFQNPTKNMHIMLGELRMLFSKAVDENSKMSVGDFQKQLTTIIARAKEFGFDKQARDMTEEFLIDGRFALFTDGIKNFSEGADGVKKMTNYQMLYESAARVLGIQPETEKGKLFQSLSNIFSYNVTQEKKDLSVAIRTAAVLQNTLSHGGIDTNDYFDIAIYQFLMLKKLLYWDDKISQNKIPRNILENAMLYQMSQTIISATQKYVDGIQNKALVPTAQRVLASEFYSHMIELLLLSLYGEYTYVENGEILIKNAYIYLNDPKIAANHDEIIRKMISLRDTIVPVYENKIKPLYTVHDQSSRIEFERLITQLNGIINLLSSKNYREYQNDPYVANGDDSLHANLPKYDPRNGVLVTKLTAEGAKNLDIPLVSQKTTESSEGATASPEKEQIAKIFTSVLSLQEPIDANSLAKIPQGYLIQVDIDGKQIKMIYHAKNRNIISFIVENENRKIRIVDIMALPQLRAVAASLSEYEKNISEILKQNPDVSDGNILISLSKNQIQISGKFFPLVK